MRRVVADTNGLLLPFQFRLNLDAELDRLLGVHELLVPDQVLAELRLMGRRSRRARGALALAQRLRAVSPEASSADDAVINAAREFEACVLTNDAALLRRLERLRIPRVSLRSRSRLVLEGA